MSAFPGEPAPRYLLDLGGVLMRMRIGARPVVLSACGSGLSGTASPDEVVGLPTGLLQAGAAAVVAPPGEVPDATALPLTTDFRDRWRTAPGAGTAAALAAARRWLRTSSDGAGRDRFTRWPEHGHPRLPVGAAEACFEAVALLDPLRFAPAPPVQWAASVHVGA
ncbi:CHAT domain-containing protein [Streptomyces viridosporus]|uniref:CHAT domain-containing protein n=1 Tax=Streptomyces viridosporus TaxID=67581 RepID=UPI00341CD461